MPQQVQPPQLQLALPQIHISPEHTRGSTTTRGSGSGRGSGGGRGSGSSSTTSTTPTSTMASAFLYMTQAKIIPYGGYSSFTEWINGYEHLCDTYKQTAEQRLANLLLNLKGPAKHCYRLEKKQHGVGFTYAIAVATLKAGFKTKNSREEFLRILENRKFQ